MIMSQSGECSGKLEAVCYNAVESHSNLNLYHKKLLFPSIFHTHTHTDTQHNFNSFQCFF